MQTERLILLSDISVLQKNKLVLTHVDLEVYAGEFLYLIGKTGSGKSSLLQLLYADLALEQGEATVCGYNLKVLKRKEVPFLRRKLGIVFQDFQLLDDRNVRKNLQFVLKATGWTDVVKIEDRILQVLDEVNLVDKLNAMPHQLSGGEQQRIAIARALLNQPEVLLADEPTGNLDPDTSNGIMRILFNISEKGSAVIMATHNYNLINKFPGKVLRCEEGTLLKSGQQSD
ncbi:MAG: phosphonate ABC transporter ATP-binding protein [Bacteroidetes bacterium HGW-Bacteroidetes-16]|jgi:cell division transport system ATP-binding protein|nr:MAG: phosphonate ABC transporter ATP-binding protein [Bacteroidetes bacterium HGW-Bacteroidetes-16]